MQTFTFGHYVHMCLDLVLPGAQYFGILTDEASYESIRWIDERPKPTWAEIEAKWPEVEQALVWQQYKSDRTEELLRSTVTVADLTFDADEDSQNRMVRAITVMTFDPDITAVRWRLSDNTETQVDLPTMRAALKAAASKQTELWFPT